MHVYFWTRRANSSNINFGSSASQRKRRVPRTEQARTEYAERVFGGTGKAKRSAQDTSYKSKTKPTGDEDAKYVALASIKAFDIAFTRSVKK